MSKTINDLWVEMLLKEGIVPTAGKTINDLLYEMLQSGLLGRKGVVKTGQLTSYVDYDDGYYQKGLPVSGARFTDNGDGTITDNVLKLQWAKDGNGAGCNNGGTLAWAAAISFCKNLNFANHTDWRLPNVKELQSIVDYELVYPAINQTFFPNTQSNFYWSGTTYADYTDGAWFVSFYDGYVYLDNRVFDYYVRPVRSSQ